MRPRVGSCSNVAGAPEPKIGTVLVTLEDFILSREATLCSPQNQSRFQVPVLDFVAPGRGWGSDRAIRGPWQQ